MSEQNYAPGFFHVSFLFNRNILKRAKSNHRSSEVKLTSYQPLDRNSISEAPLDELIMCERLEHRSRFSKGFCILRPECAVVNGALLSTL